MLIQNLLESWLDFKIPELSLYQIRKIVLQYVIMKNYKTLQEYKVEDSTCVKDIDVIWNLYHSPWSCLTVIL